jgi:hypothetical protein
MSASTAGSYADIFGRMATWEEHCKAGAMRLCYLGLWHGLRPALNSRLKGPLYLPAPGTP